MSEDWIIAIFRTALSVVVGGYILVMMVYDLWMEYEKLKQNWRK